MDFDLLYEEAIRSGNESLGIQLALERAKSQGYNVPAYHGTFQTFEEFREHDIGFHFAKCKYVAMNRLDDKFEDSDLEDSGKILHVVLSIHNPIVVKADLGSWNAKDILDAASYRYTGKPFISQSTMYLYEQKAWAYAAHRILKSIGIDKGNVLELKENLDKDPNLNNEYTEFIRQKCIESKYDAIIYPNDFESQDGFDQTSYIVFLPNQIKTLSPVMKKNETAMRKLSSRFDKSSNNFTW